MAAISEVSNSVREFLTKSKPDNAKAIKDTDNLFEKGVMDSLQVVATVSFIEDTYKCQLDFEDLNEENMESIATISKLVVSKLTGKN